MAAEITGANRPNPGGAANRNERFVRNLFQQVMDREGQPNEIRNWTNRLNQGDDPMAVFDDFLLSGGDPNLDDNDSQNEALQNGIRDAARQGVQQGMQQARQEEAAQAAAAQNQTGDPKNIPDNNQFVQRLYRDLLGREADPQGLADWSRALNSGEKNRNEIMEEMKKSDEYKARHPDNDDDDNHDDDDD